MKWLDGLTENKTRHIAQRTSRRGFLGKLAGVVAGGAALPLCHCCRLPEARKVRMCCRKSRATQAVAITGDTVPSMAFFAAVAAGR